MAECPYFEHLLVIPRLRVQNANAISSPLTHGFPSMTAFLGLMWALERKTRAEGLDVQFNAVGVVAHNYQELVTDDGFVNGFRLTRNPIDKDGSTAAIVEEGRIHLDVSLVFAVQSATLNDSDEPTATELAAQVRDLIAQMRIAGGSVVPSTAPRRRQIPYVVQLTGNDEGRRKLFDQAKLRLLPGFTLVDRSALLEERLAALRAATPQASKLDAWLSLSRINWYYDAKEAKWLHDRKGLGWVVPIPVGYGALSDLHEPGTVKNARDSQTPFRFVESVFSMGEWLSPHRLQSPQQLLWYADAQPDAGLYRCRNDYQPAAVYDFD